MSKLKIKNRIMIKNNCLVTEQGKFRQFMIILKFKKKI